ncbi:PaaI family thioesterase [Paremcibacter congregatus]|uniref:Thioesterase n=1 Tax=Paremcibacter congregatus TaxID=2043170 RepID=A0A2G4YT76_9PROT|nr:PaaI family thioesterase [Paremcibacter congregatus]PHZ85531.1 thioesterase [Paremcibacter congregatus]QDE26489.1 PaaI family thioesterase [Paremcibacter congregatus]
MIRDFLQPLKKCDRFDQGLDFSPYAAMMGFRLRGEQGALTSVMEFHDDLVGSPYPPALHGGTVASLMEMAALLQLVWQSDREVMPKAIDITIDYLRSGQPEDTYARARIFRQGRRFATLHAEAWQSNPEKPIASAMLHFQMVD